MNQRKLAIFASVLFQVSYGCIGILFAQNHCDPSLPLHTDSPLSYRNQGSRCEGIYIKEVGSTTLLIVSLIESFEEYDLTSSKALIIEWDKPSVNSPVHLRAQGLKRRLYYRMDSYQPLESRSYSWPIDVLSSIKVLKKDIGVVGVTEYSQGQKKQVVYLPLRISQTSKALRTNNYKLVLLPGVELTEVFISIARMGTDWHQEKFIKEGEKLGYGYYPAERGIEIPISGLKETGIYYLEIGATLRSGGTSTIELLFYYPNG